MPEIDWSTAFLWMLFGYGLGSIPFGVVLARVFGLGDLRKIGSGNIGATNVLRTGNKTAAALTLVLDGLKGLAAALIAGAIAGEGALQLAALGAFLGHCFPVWLNFKGGKGVATFIAITYALSVPLGLAISLTWLAIAAVLRFSSLAALGAAGMSTIYAVVFEAGTALFLLFILTLLIYGRHWANIQRLLSNTEPKIGAK